MALQKGKNCFVTINEADDYFNTRINSDAWFNAQGNLVEQALVTATGIIDNLVWSGTATPTETYPLSWPRDITYYDTKYGEEVDLEDDRTSTSEGTIPEDIKQATYELALHLVSNMSTIEKNANGENKVKDLTVGSVRMIFDINTGESNYKQLPDPVYMIVSKYLNANAAGSRGVFVSGGA